jgi:tetratricopeptide (TPR) repeat protein
VSPPVDLAPAHALVDAGCYRCLADAYELYQRALNDPVAGPDARSRLFVTAVLLALREKELDLDAAPWLQRAEAVATVEERVYLDIAGAVPWQGGSSPDFTPAATMTPALLENWRRVILPAGRYPSLDHYILLTLECQVGTRTSMEEALRSTDRMLPLLQYRAGICTAAQRPLLEALAAAVPRFVEAWYFIGRYEMASGVNAGAGSAGRQWLTTAVAPLTRAHEGLPEAPTVATALARLMAARSDFGRALALYDAALARRPTHADAALGRVVMLSYLKRYDEAIDAATTIIALERGHVPSAWYYRAWNRYQKRQLEPARQDVATAIRLSAPDEVHVLSGLVAYDQQRPADARADFTTAVLGNRNRCTAHWYLGILDLDAESWAGALGRFSDAAECYVATAASLERQTTQLPEDLPPDVKAAQVASLQEDLIENRRQAGRSYFNAAQAAMRLDDRGRALQHARMAAGFDDMRERAEAMVKNLEAAPVQTGPGPSAR